MFDIIYNKNDVFLTKTDLKSIAYIFREKKICHTFSLDKKKIRIYMKMFLIYKMYITNKSDEKTVLDAVNSQLETVGISLQNLENDCNISKIAIEIMLSSTLFFKNQLSELYKKNPTKSPFFQEKAKKIFHKYNEINYFICQIDGREFTYSSDLIDESFYNLLKSCEIGEQIVYKGEKISLISRYILNRKHKVYKFYYIVLKNVYEDEVKSFIYGIMDFYSSAAIASELKIHYGSKLVQNTYQTVYSSSYKPGDQNIIQALEARQGKCFINSQNNNTIILILDEVYDQDVFYQQEDLEDSEDLIVEQITDKIRL